MSSGCLSGQECPSENSTNDKGASFTLPQPINYILKLEPKFLNTFSEATFETLQLRNVKEIVLSRTEIQELPKNFTSNLINVTSLNLGCNELNRLPDNINRLVHLQYLNISHNHFNCLSDELGTLSNLQVLIVSHNQIAELPVSVSFLKNLKHLNVSNNALSRMPNEIGNLVNLETLDVSNNSLLELPNSIGELRKLFYVDASVNKIFQLPECCTLLSNLNTLNLSHNDIKNVPECIVSSLQNIASLDMSHNNIMFFDTPPKCMSKLVKLDLSYNVFNDIPQWLFGSKCRVLADLNISNNKNMIGSSQVSSYLKHGNIYGMSVTLKCLRASNCCLTSTSLKFLHGLQALEQLTLGNEEPYNPKCRRIIGNVLFNFPTSTLSTCVSLKHLNLNGVGLTDLPEDIASLSPQLQYLDISCNDLHWLPAALCTFVALTDCQFSNCQLALLPDEFGQLTSLKKLRLDGNKLQSLPDSFIKLTQLWLLDLYNNLFDHLPKLLLELPCLEALDVEFNYFNIIDIADKLNEEFLLKYTTWKENIRILATYTREDGNKPDTSQEDYCSDEDDGLDDISSDELPMDTGVSWCQEDRVCTREEEEENWDLSDDPDSTFDPHYMKKLLPKRPLPQALLVHESIISLPDNFCPADIHSLPIKQSRKVVQHEVPILAEGQFDDAEDT